MSLRVGVLVGLVLGLIPLGARPAPARKLPAKLSVLWKFSASDPIEGAVTVKDGVVYVPSMDGHVYAVGLADGKKKWGYVAGKKDPAPFRAAPAVRDGLVYAGDVDGGLHCIDAKTGKRKWLFREPGGEL